MNKKDNGAAAIIAAYLILGVAGGFLRGLELAEQYDPVTRLFSASVTDIALPACSWIAGILALVAAWLWRGKQREYLEVYAIETKPLAMVSLLAILALACIGAAQALMAVRLHQFGRVLFGVLTVITAFGFFAQLAVRVAGRLAHTTRLMATMPIFWGSFLMILTFMEHPAEPVLRVYAYDLLATCGLLTMVYLHNAGLFRRTRREPLVFVSLMGLYLMILCLTGRCTAWLISGDRTFVTDYGVRLAIFTAMLPILLPQTAQLLNSRKE